MDSIFFDEKILSGTSSKTLDTMRCTSKELDMQHTPTYDSNVIDHYMQSNIVSGFLVQNIKGNYCEYFKEFAPSPESKGLDLNFLPRNSHILATSEQGIIVFEIPDPRKRRNVLYHVCKPATKQILALPNPKTKYITEKIAIVVVGLKPLHYKIIRLSKHPNISLVRRRGNLHQACHCEIFDSMTWAWKLLDLLLPYEFIPTLAPPITATGSIYMLSYNDKILKFNAYSGKWTMFPSPIQAHGNQFGMSKIVRQTLVKYEGKLGLVCKPSNGFWEIWVLKSNELWEKVYVCNGKDDIERELPDALYDSKTSIIKDYNTLLFYKFKGGNDIKEVVLRHQLDQMFVFRSDFDKIDLRGRE